MGNDDISGTLLNCAGCGKPIIERMPDGSFRFKFGRPVNESETNREIEKCKNLLGNIFFLKGVILSSRSQDEWWEAAEHLLSLCPQLDSAILDPDAIKKEALRVLEILNGRMGKLYRKNWLPVLIYARGEIRLRCFRKKCGAWNIFS